VLLPEFEPTIGLDQASRRQHLTLDEHIFSVVQAAADAAAPLAVRLAALLHDLGKPNAGGDHAVLSAEIGARVLDRLRYPNRLRTRVTRIVRAHSFKLVAVDELYARRFLREHGEEVAFDLVTLKECDLRSKRVSPEEVEAAARLRLLLEQERSEPHRLADLAVDGADLIELGFTEGPGLGRVLESLLDAVVEDPALNTREVLLERARRQLL
jgi:tRNA nucleotidyltransferase (CCA-adding enzyme)